MHVDSFHHQIPPVFNSPLGELLSCTFQSDLMKDTARVRRPRKKTAYTTGTPSTLLLKQHDRGVLCRALQEVFEHGVASTRVAIFELRTAPFLL